MNGRSTDIRWLLAIVSAATLLIQAGLWHRVLILEAQITAVGTQLTEIAAILHLQAAGERPRHEQAASRPRSARSSPVAMTSPLLRLFAVCWWLVVIGSAGLALFGTLAVWRHYHSPATYTHPLAGWTPAPPDPSLHVAAGAVVLLFSLLPIDHRGRDPPDRVWPLALRPALVALAPARRGSVAGQYDRPPARPSVRFVALLHGGR